MTTHRVPWLRVLIEGVVIVGSILLAFGIDAWWEGSRDRREEVEILTALQDDFARNRVAAAAVVSGHEGTLIRHAWLRLLSDQEILSLPPDTVGPLAALAAPYTFDAIRGTVDALIGSGELGLIREPRLRESLVTFLNLVDDSVEDARYLGSAAEAVWVERLRVGGPWSQELRSRDLPVDPSELLDPFTNESLLQVRRDQSMMARIENFYTVVTVYLEVVRGIQDQIEVIEELLRQEVRG